MDSMLVVCFISSAAIASISMVQAGPVGPCLDMSSGSEQLLPDDSNCMIFYVCDNNGLPIQKECPARLHFNSILKTCDWPENSNCENKVEVTQRTDDTTTDSDDMHTTEAATESTDSHTTTDSNDSVTEAVENPTSLPPPRVGAAPPPGSEAPIPDEEKKACDHWYDLRCQFFMAVYDA